MNTHGEVLRVVLKASYQEVGVFDGAPLLVCAGLIGCMCEPKQLSHYLGASHPHMQGMFLEVVGTHLPASDSEEKVKMLF